MNRARASLDPQHLLVAALAVAAVGVHLATATRYPLFRDELYYLESVHHLAWGYVDHPPLSILLLAGWRKVFGDSELSVHVPPALAHGALVLVAAALARRLGGGRFAQGLAALAVLVAPGYLAMTGLYSMNAFDLLFWAGACLLLLRALATGATSHWLVLGGLVGLGLENKASMLVFAGGLFVALLATRERRLLGTAGPWLAAGVALALFVPHLLWQRAHGWPTLEFMANAERTKNVHLGVIGFASGQLDGLHPFNAILALLGLLWLLAAPSAARFRPLAWIYLAAFAVFALRNGKPYYLYAAGSALLAAGAVALEQVADVGRRRWARVAAPLLLVVAGALAAPSSIPVLSVDRFLAYQRWLGASPSNDEHQAVGLLPPIFADRFGWQELAEAVAAAHRRLPPKKRARTAIVAGNYGEAGAIDHYGRALGLPRAFSQHNSYYLWGRPDGAEAFLVVGVGRADLERVFASVTEVGRRSNPYAMPYEADLPIYLCQGLKVPLDQVWRQGKHFI
jgi:hypothetical protein